jgi:hypothetical protein
MKRTERVVSNLMFAMRLPTDLGGFDAARRGMASIVLLPIGN